MHQIRTATRPAAALVAVLTLAACGGALPIPLAERARPAPEAPAAVAPADPDACWAQASVTLPQGVAEERLFAVPCPAALTPDLWSSVQRALAARGHYAGPITGRPDAATAEAVRRFQAPLGLDSTTLSLDGARHLGLIAWPRHRL